MVSEDVERIANVVRKYLLDARIVLFMFRARGNTLRESDIDLIIVSSGFEACASPIGLHTY